MDSSAPRGETEEGERTGGRRLTGRKSPSSVVRRGDRKEAEVSCDPVRERSPPCPVESRRASPRALGFAHIEGLSFLFWNPLYLQCKLLSILPLTAVPPSNPPNATASNGPEAKKSNAVRNYLCINCPNSKANGRSLWQKRGH